MVECWCKVPRSSCVVAPGLTLCGLYVNHDFGSDGGHRSFVEGKHTLHSFVCGKTWVGGARAKHVQCDVGLLQVFAPVGKAVSAWCAGAHCYKVVFPSSNGPLSRVGTMHIGWGVLKFGVICGDESLDIF